MSPRAIVGDMFKSLRIRNYRLFTTGQLISLCGTWMQVIAQSLLVLKLTGSGVALGIATGLQFLPTALAGLWGGLVADRLDKRKVLLATQAAAGTLALALGLLVWTGVVQIWMVYMLAFLVGIVTAIDTPVRQAFVIELVGAEDMPNAIGLNSAVFNVARIVGPALAAAVIAGFGFTSAFIINAVSYVAPIVGLIVMDQRALFRQPLLERSRGQVREGLRYVWRSLPMRRTLMLLAVVATIGLNYTVTLPLLAKFTFHKDAGGLAILTTVYASGALIGALVTARRARPTPQLLTGTAAAFGLAAIFTSISPTFVIACIPLAISGAFGMSFITTANSSLQMGTLGVMRGRVMAIYALVFLGSTPLGGPLVGWISQHFSPRVGIGAGGTISVAAALIAFGAASMRRARGARTETIGDLPELESAVS